ncbi:MAG: ABC transporter permease [Clostridia bacterium]|nr:ABC transporter permease [Clostridia bacterium]
MKPKALAYPYSIWVLLFTIIPILLVVFFSFTDKNWNFTFDNIIRVGKYSGVFLKSIGLGGIATAICFLLGYPMAYVMSEMKVKNQQLVSNLIMLPMWISFLLRTYAWMTLLEDNGLINKFLNIIGLPSVHMINTQGAVILGMVYDFLPFMILPIYTVLSQLDKSVIEAAKDLGANNSNLFFRVIFPLSIPGIISGVTMVFVPAVSTFIISKMLGGGENMLIGDLIESQFLGTSYNPHLGSAMSLILMILILICMGIMNQIDNRPSEEKGVVV